MNESDPAPVAYIWFDCEFTSLNLQEAHLLQVALTVTDVQLNRLVPIEADLNIPVQVPPGTTLSPWVEENLSELVATCRGPEGVPLKDVDTALAALVDRAMGEQVAESIKDRPVVAGNSVYNDLIMAKRLLPQFASRVHYRLLDVSSLKLVWQVQGAGPAFNKEDAQLVKKNLPVEADLEGRPHDAYYDILASMAEYNFYRERMVFS